VHFGFGREWLVKNKYAARGKVILNGGSNGGNELLVFSSAATCLSIGTGLLVSACVNRAPDGLIGAAIAEVGVHDLLKVWRLVSVCLLVGASG